MSEALNPDTPNHEQHSMGYPAFNPEAAKVTKQQYKAIHPNAEEDIDRAHIMALAGYKYRTAAYEERKKAGEYRKQAEAETDESKAKILKEKAENATIAARLYDEIAGIDEEQAGHDYDWENKHSQKS